MPVLELKCKPNNYHWGRVGSDSLVARLAQRDSDFHIDENEHYAELWMGDHAANPSYVATTGELLSTYLAANSGEALTAFTQGRFGQQLPYLLKCLSINQALSIQAHPDAPNAMRLHGTFPTIYKDGNHKPEMLVALSDTFVALCGFRPYAELEQLLAAEFPELRTLVAAVLALPHPALDQCCATRFGDAQAADAVAAKLRDASTPLFSAASEQALVVVFHCVMHCPLPLLQATLHSICARLQADAKTTPSPHEKLFATLNSQYACDVGTLSALFLNIITLRRNEALFMGPNELHAYIAGECIECMAPSDNVVRAGLTPKFKDVDTMFAILKFTAEAPDAKLLAPSRWNRSPHTLLFDPPFPEFVVLRTSLPENETELLQINGPSVMVVTAGSGSLTDQISNTAHNLSLGSVFFVTPESPCLIQSKSNDLVIFTASSIQKTLPSS